MVPQHNQEGQWWKIIYLSKSSKTKVQKYSATSKGSYSKFYPSKGVVLS